MPHMRRFVPSLAAVVAVFLCLLVVNAACSGSQRTKALRTTVIALNTARDGMLAFDQQHQLDLVNGATSREDGEAKLAAYRTKRIVVVNAFEVAYRAVAVAATASDNPSYETALQVAQVAIQAYHDLTGGK